MLATQQLTMRAARQSPSNNRCKPSQLSLKVAPTHRRQTWFPKWSIHAHEQHPAMSNQDDPQQQQQQQQQQLQEMQQQQPLQANSMQQDISSTINPFRPLSAVMAPHLQLQQDDRCAAVTSDDTSPYLVSAQLSSAQLLDSDVLTASLNWHWQYLCGNGKAAAHGPETAPADCVDHLHPGLPIWMPLSVNCRKNVATKL
jgi:hypothetical protein